MNSMTKTMLVFILICSCSIANAGKSIEQPSTLDNLDSEKLPTVVIKPKIHISDVKADSYNIKIDKFLPNLQKLIIVENPDLKRIPRTLTNPNMQAVDPVKDLGINHKISRYVISFPNQSITMVGSNENVFVSGISHDKHLNYFFVKPNFSYYHPINKEYLGTEILIIGKATVLNRDKISLLRIDSAKEPIKLGTLILPSRSLNLPSNLRVFSSENKFEGYILSVVPTLTKASNNSIIIISLGARENIKVGQLMHIKQQDFVTKDPYNNNKSHVIKSQHNKGQVVIYEVFNKLSLGIVIKAREDIKVMDKVVSMI